MGDSFITGFLQKSGGSISEALALQSVRMRSF